MKQLYTIALGILGLPLMAQQVHHAPWPPLPQEKHTGGMGSPVLNNASGVLKGTSYFSENFDGGLNGWTVNTPVGTVNWDITSTGPGPTTSTYPVPPLNSSTPGGWAIVDDDYLGTSGVSSETWLVSPVIDLSLAPTNLKVEFEQYFQEWQTDHCYVGVTTDGGGSWNEVEINEGVGRDGRPNPELVDVNISPWVANDPANVQLRFRYVSTWDYGWQIDNVVIKDLPANDMALTYTKQTSFDFGNTGLENIEYSIYPIEQIREMQLHGGLKNKGYLPQTGAVVNAVVTGPNGQELSTMTNGVDYAPAVADTVVIDGYVPSGDIGDYSIALSVVQNETDDVPSNNTMTSTFAVSQYEWAQDDGICMSTQAQGPNNEQDQYELGNYFDVVQQGSQIEGVKVALHESTTPGALIYGVLCDIDLGYIALTDDHEVQANELNPIGGSNFITLPFAEPLDLDAGTAYCVMVGYYGGAEDMVFCTSGISDPQVSIIRYPASDEQFFVTKTPMVRALLGGVIGIDEPAGPITGAVRIWPNPATDASTIAFTLQQSADVSVRLMDALGRVVRDQKLGRMPIGRSTHQLDMNALAPGLYTYLLLADGQRRTGHVSVIR
ncbi:MAG: T9SS type A sorting domain-containing protein [Flavobacteriales bacterium]|nr:T9SS type A sorting domain-containing protein [Flavobacteriales bacterium]MCB9193320.1 T9SS type A sorting domain-containing protein [Flavobacteriales bacterium]